MKRNISFTLALVSLLIFGLSCKKEDQQPLSNNRNVDVFTDSNFIRYNSNWNGNNFVLNSDGTITIVGIGKDQVTSFLNQPFYLKLNLQNDIDWIEFIQVDDQNLFRDIFIIPTLDNKYMIMTYSDPFQSGDFNIDLIKATNDGTINWNKRLVWEGFREKASSIIQLENGDFIILSRMDESLASNANNFLLFRVSENGDIIWSKVFEDEIISSTKQLIYIPEENSIIAMSEHQISTNLSLNDIKIHKFDLDGNQILKKSNLANEILWPLSGRLTLTRNKDLFLMYSSNKGESENNHEVVLAKLDHEGNKVWEKIFEGESTDKPENIISTKDQDLLMLSNTTSYGNGEFDLMLTKLDNNGNIIWDKVYGSSSSDQGIDLLEKENGNIIILGNTNHNNSSDSNFDFFILETDSEGNPI